MAFKICDRGLKLNTTQIELGLLGAFGVKLKRNYQPSLSLTVPQLSSANL